MTWVLYGLAVLVCLVFIGALFWAPRRLLILRRRKPPKE